MKKVFLISVVLFLGVFSAFAQSTVYLCYDYPNKLFPIPIKINNQEVFTMTAKTQKKCTLYSEGKVIISFDVAAKNPHAPDITYQWADEIQLNLSKNSVHYIQIKAKGLKQVQFVELSEKEFAKKKNTVTAEYAEQPSDNSSDTGKKGKVAPSATE